MTKLELEALRCLPRLYVRDGTQVCLWSPPQLYPMVIAIHTQLPPIAYHSKGKKWKHVEWRETPNDPSLGTAARQRGLGDKEK